MALQQRHSFWQQAFALHGSITSHVMPYVVGFGFIAAGVCVIAWLVERFFETRIALEVNPFEIAGAVLGLLLVVRTNAGYDRWWEARKLWGGIVNQSRNLIIGAMSYGPDDSAWREQMVRWTAVFAHVARHSLRGEKPGAEVATLVGVEEAERIAAAGHMPGFVAMRLADLLREACDRLNMDRFAFLQVDRERALLIDHVGGCERILKTPLPTVYAIKVRRFIALYLLMLPLALLHRIDGIWLIPIITMLVAYPLLSLDEIGVELQDPLSTRSLSHLPLDDISATVQQNANSLLEAVKH
jgi:putative membrane protein